MLRSWKLGSAFGIDIYVHWSLLLLIGWVMFNSLPTGGVPLAVFLALLLVSVFGCVILHELGHALAARCFGIPTRDITLYVIGGVARLERMSKRPGEELVIALAGPAVNVVLAVLFGVLGVVLLGLRSSLHPAALVGELSGASFLLNLALINGLLVLLNMLPAFPMDGGRVLRALLALAYGRLRATEIAARLGAGVAFLLALWGVAVLFDRNPVPLGIGSPLLILIAAFVWFVGQQELAMVRYSEHARQAEPLDVLPVEEAAIPRVLLVEPEESPFSGLVWDDRDRVWVVWRNGRPIHTPWSN